MNAELQAGAARSDITPGMGIQLAGDIGRRRPVEDIRERLYANALAVEQDGKLICLLSADLLSMGCDWSDRIRHEASLRFGVQPEAIMLHVTQNHAAPAIGHLFLTGARQTRFPAAYPWLMGGDDRYNEPTVAACVEAIGQAVQNLQPVTLHVGHGVDGRVAFNRRFVMRDGTARCHPPPCSPEILNVEGPTDPEVAAATFTNAGGQVVAALLHHTCHPCHGYPHRFVIGDWPGAWAARMQRHWGETCVPLVINGCCGNIHHSNHLSPDPAVGHIRMAEMLSGTTRELLGNLQAAGEGRVDWRRTVLPLPLRKLDSKQIADAEELLREHPQPIWLDEARSQVSWDWVYAATVLDLAAVQREKPDFPYEIQAFRIGDLGVVSLMGEPFVEGQLDIKRQSPTRHTLVAHFCNGYAGYVPTRRAFEGGGYETRTGAGSKLPEDALERVAATAVQLLNDVFEK